MRTVVATLFFLPALTAAIGCAPDAFTSTSNGLDAGLSVEPQDAGPDAGGEILDAGEPEDAGTPPPPQRAFRLGAEDAVTRGAAAIGSDSGALFVAGTTNGALDEDGPFGALDTFVARVSAEGHVQWLQQLGGPGYVGGLVVRANAVALGRSGDVIVAGTVNGKPEFQGQPLPALYNGFVVAFDPANGAQKWLRLISDASSATEVMGVGVAPDGSIVAAGYTSTTNLHGAGSLGSGDVFLAWLSESGDINAVRRYGGAGEEYPSAFGVGPHGLYFARQEVEAAAGKPTSLELVQVGFDGAEQHRRTFADPLRWTVAGIAGVADGVCAAYQVRGVTPEGNAVIGYGLGCFDELLAPRYEFLGSDPANDARALGLHCDSGRRCTVFGHALGAVDGVPTQGDSDGFAVQVNPLGSRTWTTLLGDTDQETPTRLWAVVPASGGESWAFGDTQGELFGGAVGRVDAFVARLGVDGEVPNSQPLTVP